MALQGLRSGVLPSASSQGKGRGTFPSLPARRSLLLNTVGYPKNRGSWVVVSRNEVSRRVAELM
jgi:hypothetical protein